MANKKLVPLVLPFKIPTVAEMIEAQNKRVAEKKKLSELAKNNDD